MTKIVIEKNKLTGWFDLRYADGSVEPTAFPITRRLGDVAKIVAKAHPDTQIGCRAADFGPACIIEFGSIVWLRPDFAEG